MSPWPPVRLTSSRRRTAESRFFFKNGTLRSQPDGTPSSFTLDNFFGTTGSFDPWPVYDPYIQRFWLFAVNETDPSTSTYLIALSNTSEANDLFRHFSLDARAFGNNIMNQWCDYPKLGIDSQAIYLTCNMFTFPAVPPSGSSGPKFVTNKIRVMTKNQFVNDTCCSWWDFWNFTDGTRNFAFTIQPAVMIGATNANGEFLIAAQGQGGRGGALEVYQITNAQNCCLPAQTGPFFAQAERRVGSYSRPPAAGNSCPTPPSGGESSCAPQPNGVQGIDTGDTRLLYAFWQNGKLVTGQNTACGDGTNTCAVFDEFNVSRFPTITTLNDWVLSSSGHAYYPMVAANSAGNRTMVYNRSTTTEFVGAWFVGIPPASTCTGCADGPETALHAGQNTYVVLDSAGSNRWGDYSGASPDPDGTGIWIRGQYASNTQNVWATDIGLTYESVASTMMASGAP
jgi:hypothetical protein